MKNKGMPFGKWINSAGKNYTGTGGTDNGDRTKRMSTSGYYHVAFVKTYAGLTERDLELKIDYGKDLVSQHLSVPCDMVNLRRKTEKLTVTSVDTVYYVRVGREVVGKLAIRVIRGLEKNSQSRSLVFIFSTKDYAPKQIRRVYKGQKSITGVSKSDRRQQKRRRKRKGTTD